MTLTGRKWEVIEAVGRGLRNRDIARGLGISEKTVTTHLNPISSKSHGESRFTLALWAQGGVQPRAYARKPIHRLLLPGRLAAIVRANALANATRRALTLPLSQGERGSNGWVPVP